MSNRITIPQALDKLEAGDIEYSLAVMPDKDYLKTPKLFTRTGEQDFLDYGGTYKNAAGDIEYTKANKKALLKTADNGGLNKMWTITLLPSELWKFWHPYDLQEEIDTDALRVQVLLNDRSVTTTEELESIVQEKVETIMSVIIPEEFLAESSNDDD